MLHDALFVFLSAATTNPSAWATYGPLVAAIASVLAVGVSFLTRRDRQRVDAVTGLDQRTNTALKGLSDAYDRVEQQRGHEERGRITAESRADTAETKLHELLQQVEELEQRVEELQLENTRLKRRRRTP